MSIGHEHRDTTIKLKAQPIDVTDDAADVEEFAEHVLEQSTNVELDEALLVGQRAGIGEVFGSNPDHR